MAEQSGSLEDPDVPAQDSDVPDPTGAREEPGTSEAIDDATEAAKNDIAAALSDPSAGEDASADEESPSEEEPPAEEQQ